MTKCLEEEAGDHWWKKCSSDVFDALHFIIYGDRVTNLLMAKRKVGLFLDSTKNHHLYKPSGPELRKLMIQPCTKYAFCFE
jgi:hypothetical protein